MAASTTAYGLVSKGNNSSLPLKSVHVDAQVRGFVLGLQSTLTYSNDSSDPVEVLFRFPLEKSHAVVGLTALIDGRKIKADIREKEEARAQYDDAIASGLSAALGEEKSGDVFSVALGNLPPDKEAQIELKLVGELTIDAEGGVRFSLPATLKPRYTPVGSSDPLASVPTGEGQQVESGSVSAVSWFHMTVEGAGDVAEVTSPTHSITVTPNEAADQLDVCLSEEKELCSDLVILVKYKNQHVPRAFVEHGVGEEMATGKFMSGSAVMVNFFPSFTKIEAACEFIFLVDRSGSMSGSYIRSARETLVLFLKSLPEGSYFNILGFGSSYEKLFPQSVPYKEEYLEKAIKHAQGMSANLGGTELLPPLKHVFGLPHHAGYSRQVFVLTDGSVSNTNACIQQMQKNVHKARCFTFGIGSGASTALVEGLARAGKGTAEFVKEGERLQPKVIRSLKRALQPAFTDVTLEFKVPAEYEVVKCPQNLPPIFNGEKLVVYASIQAKAPVKKGSKCFATLRGKMNEKKQEYKLPFLLDGSVTAPILPVIHHLAAKTLIIDWECEEKEKKSIIDLSIESNVISSYTAFIAVDEESSEPVSGPMKTFDLRAQQYGSNHSLYSSSGSDDDDSFHFGVYDEEEDEEGESERQVQHVRPKRRYMKLATTAARNYKTAEVGENDLSMPMLEEDLCEAELEYELESWSEGEGQERVKNQRMGKKREKAANDKQAGLNTLTQIITAQQVNGSWALNSSLAQLIGKSLPDVESACPTGVRATVWATVLAVSFLKVRYSSQQDEWELIIMKAESWLKKQSFLSGCTLDQLFQAAASFN